MKRKTYIILLISISLMMILGGILFYGASSVLSLKEQGSTLRGELDSWLRRSRDSSNLQETLAKAKNVKTEMDNYVFVATEENQIAFISEIENIMSRTGTRGEVRSLDVTPDYTKLICSITFSGDWPNVYQTILALEAYPIKINLDDVSIVEEKPTETTPSNAKILSQEYRANVKFTITSMRKPL